MNSAVDLLNNVLTKGMDVLCDLMSFMPQGLQLVVLSIISGVLLLLLYGRLSNQKKLRQVKDKIYGSFLEAVLFRHDGALALKAQSRMICLAFRYFAQAVPPILLLMLPCILLLAQLNMRYAYKPLSLGKEISFSAIVKDAAALQDINLKVDAKLDATSVLRLMKERRVLWKLRALEEGEGRVSISSGVDVLEETISIGGEPSRIIPGQSSAWWIALLYPGRKILSPESSFEEIWLSYPEKTYRFLGLEWNWLVIFILLSIIAGLLGSKIFDVEI